MSDFFDDTVYQRSIDPVGALAVRPPGAQMPTVDTPAPTLWETTQAAFRQDNTVVSTLQRWQATGGISDEPEPDYNPWDSIKGTKYERRWSSFVDIRNRAQDAAMRAQLDTEDEDRATVAASGVSGVLMSMAAGIADPTVLLPVGGALRAAGGGIMIGASALRTGAMVGAGVAVQEGILQATQETRPVSESLMSVGAGVALGALLGGGAAALLSRGERAAAMAAYERMLPDTPGGTSEVQRAQAALPAQPLGAAEVERLAREDLTIAGGAMRTYGEAISQINPILRGNTSPSAAVREISANTGQNSLYQQAHAEGRATRAGGDAETDMQREFRSRMGQATKEFDDIWLDARKTEFTGARVDFNRAVGRAMRRNDLDEAGNDAVTRAAKLLRSRIFDPFKEDAIAARLLPADVSVDEALSYFSRVYNRDLIVADESGWRNAISPHIAEKVQADYAGSMASRDRQLARISQELDDLRAPAAERASRMNEIEARGQALDAANADNIDRLSRVAELRQEARATRDPRARAALREQIARVRAEGGDGLRAYEAERATLRRRQRTLSNNYAGMTERTEAIQNRLVDIEDAHYRTLGRLVEKGRRFERDAARLDPERFRIERDRLYDALDTAAKQAERASTSVDKQLVRLRETTARRVESAENAKATADRKLEAATKAAERLVEREKALRSYASENLTVPEQAASAAQRATAVDLAEELATARKIEAAAKAEADKAALAEKQAKLEAAAEAKAAEVMEADAKRAAQRAEDMDRIRQRIARVEDYDPNATLAEIRKGVEAAVEQANRLSLSRGERAKALILKQADLNPERLTAREKELAKARLETEESFNAKWRAVEDEGPEGFARVVSDIVDDITAKITGRNFGADTVLPDFMTPIARGPLKERTFHIPDAMIEKYLESDAMVVAERYARTMAGEIALARRFETPTMKPAFDRINQDYADLRSNVAAAQTPKEVREIIGKNEGLPGIIESVFGRNDDLATAQQKANTYLSDRQRADVRDISALRDNVRGTYKAAESASNWGTLTRGLLGFNTIRLMGGVVVANLTEMTRPAMVHGFDRYLGEAVPAMINNFEAFKLSVKEAQLGGLVLERYLQSRLASVAEMSDPFARGNRADRVIRNTTNFAMKFTGLNHLTDFNESVGALLSQNRLIDTATSAKPSARDLEWLRYIGVDDAMQSRIAQQFAEHGDTNATVKIANTELWTDDAAVRAYRNAVAFDVNSIVVRRSAGDVPLHAHTNLGKLFWQFRGYNLAANQKVMMRAFQEGRNAAGAAQLAGGLVAMTTLGMGVAMLQAWRGGDDRWEKWKESARNPGFLIGEGLDRSGIFPLVFEVANATDTFSRAAGSQFNPIKTPLIGAFGGGQDEGGRAFSRDVASALAGPSAGLPTQIARAMGGAASFGVGGSPNAMQVNAATGLVPLGAHLGVREMLQVLTGNSPYTR